jgi:hypothetical protein
MDSAELELHGLQSDARYEVKNVDAPGSQMLMGSELMQKGLHVSFKDRPEAVVFTYKRIDQK